MYSPYLTRVVGCFYWKTVKRWPVVHMLWCCFGIATGIGSLYLFGTVETNARKAIFLRVLGIAMLFGYSWVMGAFFIRYMRGTWTNHCDQRIALFEGL